ncbi:MAG: hypothetical protein IKH88_18165 [Prevotella sp.]|nr:hypothetical protein [Prevotella sp.]
MKGKQILLLLSLMTFTTSMAQDDVVLSCPDDYHPHAIDLGLPSDTDGMGKTFIADDKSWLVGTPDGKVYCYYVEGETTIGSHLYKKVMERRIVPQGDNSSYHCAVYEEDGKVWLFRSGMTEPELLYDFKAEAGDVVVKHEETWYEGRVAYTIDHVDYINVDGRRFKRQFVNDEQGQLVDVWVEGVGGSSLFGHGLRDSWPMLSCLMDGEEVFSKSYFICPDEEPAPYHRLLVVGKKWNQNYTDVCTPGDGYTFDFEIKGDTTICGVRHFKLYAHNYENKGGEKMLGLLVESNKRVYSLWTGLPYMDYQALLYDFGTEAGERLGVISSWNVRTIERDEIQHDGGTLRRQAMGYEPWGGLSSWNPINHPLDWWVEGVGSSTHFVKPYSWTPARQYRLESCTLDGDTLFTFDDFQIPEDAIPEMREVDYHPMLVEGKSWLYHFTQGHSDMETGGFWQTAYDVTYTLRGDTIIDGREYMKMYEEYEGRCNYHSAWREDGMKIYAAYPGRPDSLCYDYGLPYLGQAPYTWHGEIYEPIYLAAKDVVKAGECYHNRYLFIDDNYQEGNFWVDGVGCMNGLLYPDHPYHYYMPYWDFISCTTPDGETVTRDEIYGEAVPYVVTSVANSVCLPDSSSDKSCQAAYNIYGIKVADDIDDMSTLPPGIYIVNGRKMVVK